VQLGVAHSPPGVAGAITAPVSDEQPVGSLEAGQNVGAERAVPSSAQSLPGPAGTPMWDLVRQKGV
jgi:hypothetical protein